MKFWESLFTFILVSFQICLPKTRLYLHGCGKLLLTLPKKQEPDSDSETPYRTELLQKLEVAHSVKKNHRFNGIRKFIISFAKAKLMILILSWTNSLNIPATYFSNIHLILCSHSCLSPQDALFHSGVLIKMLYFSLFRTVLQVILISSFFYLTVLDVQINFSAYNFELSVMCPHFSLHRLPTSSHTLLWHSMLFKFVWMHHGVLRYTQEMIRQHNSFLLYKYTLDYMFRPFKWSSSSLS